MTLTPSKVNVKVTGLLNFRQLAKPCMLAAMTAAPCGAFWYIMYINTGRVNVDLAALSYKNTKKTRMWADAQRDAALPNVGGAVCESSVIPFFVRRRKVSLMPTARVPCSNAANI